MTATWDRVVYEVDKATIGAETLRGLAHGEHAVVVLKGMLPADLLAANKQRILPLMKHSNTTTYTNGALTIIGLYLIKYLSHLADYFTDARRAEALTDSVGFDLAAQVRERLREVFGLRRFEVAVENNGERCANSNVRIYTDTVATPLHNDNIMRDGVSSGLMLANLKHQLSCVVCLQECDAGGELNIYRKPWEPADEVYKIPGGLGYDLGVVSGTPIHRFRPRTGDVFLLNPTYYHAIEEVSGADRLTLGFFFGFFDDEFTEGVAWI
jgi:hypothetical protein